MYLIWYVSESLCLLVCRLKIVGPAGSRSQLILPYCSNQYQCSRPINLTITNVCVCACACMHMRAAHISSHINPVHVGQGHTYTLSHMWLNTQVPFGQIGVFVLPSFSRESFPSIQSLWSEGFLYAVFPEVKVIRLGMISGLLDLPFLLFSCSPPFKSHNPNCLFKSKNTPLPPVNVGIFFYFFPAYILPDPQHSPWEINKGFQPTV